MVQCPPRHETDNKVFRGGDVLRIYVVSQNGAPPATPLAAVFGDGEGSIGREAHNTLALPDPLKHISRVQAQMTSSWEVLDTMTPSDYSSFRNALGRSSGFQSYQYRLLEFRLGNKNADTIAVHQRDPRSHAQLDVSRFPSRSQ